MRLWALVLLLACGKDAKDTPRKEPARDDARVAVVAVDAAPAVKSDSYPDLAAALKAIVPADARVIGFGELHSRTDRAQVKSSLSRFTTDGLPPFADKLSDLIVETWIVDPKCGQAAQTATAKVEMKVRRPAETKSEIAVLAETARAAKIQPHAMKLSCADYERVAPAGQEPLPDVMLGLITKELGRIADEAVKHRDKDPGHRPHIALYGGALHNDRFPNEGVADWSYAARIDQLTGGRFVEIDLIVPELAEADPAVQRQPWFPLVKSADPSVRVWKRGERSFVVVFPRSAAIPVERTTAPTPGTGSQ
ncbi:MAG TPA: hypothetical protein VIV11_41505 [Kofleriaceae bacterium]